MATVNQLIKKSRKPKVKKTDVPALNACPQGEGFALAYILLHQRSRIPHLEKYAE